MQNNWFWERGLRYSLSDIKSQTHGGADNGTQKAQTEFQASTENQLAPVQSAGAASGKVRKSGEQNTKAGISPD